MFFFLVFFFRVSNCLRRVFFSGFLYVFGVFYFQGFGVFFGVFCFFHGLHVCFGVFIALFFRGLAVQKGLEYFRLACDKGVLTPIMWQINEFRRQ